MGDIHIKNSLVIIMDNHNMNTQSEKLTHKITVCVTEDDWIRHSQLSHRGKKKAVRKLVHTVRKQHVLETLDVENPPPVKRNTEE